MKNKSFSKTKFNIAWVSVVTIFIGAVTYVPAMHFSQKEKMVVYRNVPIPVFINNTPIDTSLKEDEVVKDSKDILTKDLKLGDVDPEVKILQKYLNSRGFIIAESGPGSPGNETELFGRDTKDALIRFQEANSEILLKPFGLRNGTGFLGELTRNLMNS